jgi:Zn-dependent protease/predicted transcriptional regulator
MGETIRLGRIRGISIGVSWTVVVIVGLLMWSLATVTLPDSAPGYTDGVYWAVGLLAAIGLMAAILAHEVSHAIVATRHGVHVDSITLWMFGGLARLSGQSRDAGTELRIALAGPAMSIAIGASCLVVAGLSSAVGGPELLTAAVTWLGVVNLVLAVFNLLPGAPLDGGRVLAAVLWRRSGDRHLAQKQSARAGRVVGQMLIALGVVELVLGSGIGGLWLALIGWFLTTAAHAEEVQDDLLATFEGIRVAEVMTTDVRMVDGRRTVSDFAHHDAVTSHVSSFPVLDDGGHLQGLVTLRRLRQLPAERWATTTLGAVAIPRDQLAIAQPSELIVDVLGRTGAGDGRVIVLDGDRVVGIVTPSDVTTALERLSLARGVGAR